MRWAGLLFALGLFLGPVQPIEAREPAFSVARLGKSPFGPLAVEYEARQCRSIDRARCAARFRRQLRSKNHPLTRAALSLELAKEERRAGDREAGERLVADLGSVRAFELTMPTGDIVTLHADPVTGLVTVGDGVELATDVQRRLVARLTVAGTLSGWVLVSGAHLQEVCLADQCASVPPMSSRLNDQFALPLRAQSPSELILALRFSSHPSSLQFGVRLVDDQFEPHQVTLSEPSQGAEVRVSQRRSQGKSSPSDEAGEFAWLPDFDGLAPVSHLLGHCLARSFSGRSPAEPGDALLARGDELTAADWAVLNTCLKGNERELESLVQARRAFPDQVNFELAYAGYRARQRHFLAAYELVTSHVKLPSLEGLTPLARPVALDVLRTILPAMGLVRLQESVLVNAVALAGPESRDAFLLSRHYIERDRYAEAVDILEPVVARWPGDRVAANTLAYVYERVAEHGKEAALMERLSWLHPTRTIILDSLALAKERGGQVEEARELYLALSEKGQHQPFLLDRAANFFLRHGDLQAATQLWTRVSTLRPQDREVRALLRRLQEAQAPVETPLTTDDEIRELAARRPVPDDISIHGVLDRGRVTVYPNGAHLLRRTQAVQVGKKGAGKPVAFEFTYDSHLEEAVVVRAEILRVNGTVSPASEYGDVSVGGEEYNLYYDLRQMVVRYVDPAPGDILVFTYDIEADPSTLGGPFSGVAWLQERYPKYNVELTIHLPQNRTLFSSVGPPEQAHLVVQMSDEGATRNSWRFVAESVPAELNEPFPPGPFERSLFVHYSTMATWQEFVDWYASVIEHVGGLDGAMEALLEEVRADAATPREVAEQLARYVADDIRYVGLELGVHGLRPYAPQEVFGRGFGDCKDKSLLFVTLLAAAGIPAHLVVVPTLPRGRVDVEPGSPSIFNHAIVYLPDWDIYFDPTARYLGLGLVPWQNQGANALIVDSSKGRLATLPVASHEDTSAHFDVLVGPGDGAALAIQGTLTFSGQFAWRMVAAMEQEGSWRNTVESYLSSVLPASEVTATEERVERGQSPSVIVTFEGRWARASGKTQLLPDGNSAFALVKRPTRQLPLVFGYPYQHRFEIRFAPEILRFVDGYFDAAQSDDAAYEVAVDGLPDGGQRINVLFEQRSRRVLPESYGAFRALVVKYQEALAHLQGQPVEVP